MTFYSRPTRYCKDSFNIKNSTCRGICEILEKVCPRWSLRVFSGVFRIPFLCSLSESYTLNRGFLLQSGDLSLGLH